MSLNTEDAVLLELDSELENIITMLEDPEKIEQASASLIRLRDRLLNAKATIEVSSTVSAELTVASHCIECGRLFIKRRKDQRFCTRKCANRWTVRSWRKRKAAANRKDIT